MVASRTGNRRRGRRPRGAAKTTARKAPKAATDPTSELRYVHHRSFTLPGAGERFFGDEREAIDVSTYSLPPEVGEPPAAQKSRRSSLSRDEERMLFLRYNYAKYRLKKLLEARGRPDDEQVELWRRRARAARDKIVHANLALVPAMAKRRSVEGVEFPDKVSEGYMAVLRCVEHFDVSRGFKFSTYACRAILACFHRMGTKAQTYRKHAPVQYDPALERDDYTDRRHERQRNDAIDSVRDAIRANTARLSDVEREVIRQRFPLGEPRRANALWETGRGLGLSTERVRQIERASLDKLRRALEEFMAA